MPHKISLDMYKGTDLSTRMSILENRPTKPNPNRLMLRNRATDTEFFPKNSVSLHALNSLHSLYYINLQT